jgi:FtsX-like permease family
MARRLFHILGKRAFLTFGFVSFLVGILLASINLTSRHALKSYVEYQLARIPWDVALYQKGPSGGEESLRDFVARTPGVSQVESLAFLRARFPEGGEVQARVDGTPFNTPWLSVLAASDLSLLPPQLGFALSRAAGGTAAGGAVLALVGPDIAIGKAFLGLQGARRFTLAVNALGSTQTVFDTPVRQVVRIDRDELNRWLMDQTGSVSYVPAIGAILLMPYDWNVITKFDLVANGIVPGDLTGSLGSDEIHVAQAEYAPELVYLARIDRSRLISGWDISGSLARVSALNARLHADAVTTAPLAAPAAHNENHHGAEEDPSEPPHPEKFGGTAYVVDSTTEVLLDRMQGIAAAVGVVSLLVALPMLWMAWVLGANLAGLLMLNERRTLGLLRLRGIAGAEIGRALIASVAAAGIAGGALGLVLGSFAALLIYERGSLPLSVLADRGQLLIFAAFLVVTVSMALLVCRRFVRYATRISPLEATRRISTSAETHGTTFGIAQIVPLVLGTYVLASWIFGWSIAARFQQPLVMAAEQLLYFIGLPLFVYGLASWIASRRARLHAVMAPLFRSIGGVLGSFALRHLSVKPERTMAFLLIVALMSSVSMYPVITSASFEEKAARGARVQIGADWQVLYNTPDLVDAAQLTGSAGTQLPAVKAAVDRLLTSLRDVEGVVAATYLIEALLPNFYLPGYGLRGVPLYLVGDGGDYQAHVYSEARIGVTDAFSAVLARVRSGDVAMSQSVAEFWQLTPGAKAVIGLNGARQAVTAPAAGVLAFLPGMPPKTVSDRQGYVQARVDYLNYLMGANAYLVSDAVAPMLSDLQVLMPRVVVLLRTTPGTDDSRLRTALAQATSVPPLELHSLGEEVQKVGNDMYISLALANMRIYLAGGLLLALVAIVAVAIANYTEDRRTLAMLRIRGASPPALWRFLLATLLAPALLGLAVGATAAGLAGFGLANYVWQLRAMRTVVQLLPTHLVVPPLAVGLVVLLVVLLVGVASTFSWWAFRHTAHTSVRGT